MPETIATSPGADPAEVAQQLQAHLEEAGELIAHLRTRCGQLRIEVTRRDAHIAHLEQTHGGQS